jgi:hypothetical protein
MCDSGGTATGGGSGTAATDTTTPTSTTSGDQPSSCGPSSGAPPLAGSCPGAATAPGASTTATPGDQPGAAVAPSTAPIAGPGTGTMSPGEESVTATGLHLVFTQPVSPSGVPSQNVEHILGEVYVDSLATLAPPVPPVDLGPSSSSAAGKKCPGARHKSGKATSGGGASAAGGSSTGGGSSLAGGSASSGSGSLSPAASTLGASASQPGSGTTGGSIPARFAAALRKPLWLLLAYVVWQALVVGTGVSLWNWRKGGVV